MPVPGLARLSYQIMLSLAIIICLIASLFVDLCLVAVISFGTAAGGGHPQNHSASAAQGCSRYFVGC